MKIQPIFVKSFFFDDAERDEDADLFEACDSVIAVLTQEQLDAWLPRFVDLAAADDAAEHCSHHTTTQAFDVDGRMLVVVADSGGELASGDFELFCTENGIPSQSVVDSPNVEGIDVNDIYTGAEEDDPELLALLHRLWN